MKVLLIIPTIASYYSFLTELTQALALRGDQVHCACSQDTLGIAQSKALEDVTVHPVAFPRGMNPITHFNAASRLNQLVHSLKPDIIHAHFSAAIFSTALAYRRNWPWTLGTAQGLGFPLTPGGKGLFLRLAETFSAKRIHATWVLTEDDRIALQAAASHAKIYRQPGYGFGCDLAHFDKNLYSNEAQLELRKQLGLDAHHQVFVYVGRFVEFKGFALVVRAFMSLTSQYSNARLLLIGIRDPLHPTGLTTAEERLIDQCPAIINLGWRADVASYLAIAKAMLFPSMREGMPVCLMEALAMGVPAITRSSRGCRDIVQDGINGFVLKDASLKNLAGAIARFIQEDELCKHFSENALQARRHFDRNAYVNYQIETYNRYLDTAAAS